MPTETLPLISVVMATYNGEKYLARQLDSLLAQTYPNVEIVICDDASTDGTSLLLASYGALHNNIRVYHNKKNLGYIGNFERAITLSSGALVALCDQDDAWHPEKLSAQYQALGDAALVYCDSRICDADLEPIGLSVSTISNCQNYTSCLQQAVFCRIYGNTMLFKKSILHGALPFPTVMPHDWWIAFLSAHRGGIVYCDQALVEYRQHADNLIGAATGSSRLMSREEKAAANEKEVKDIRERMALFYATCPEELVFEKKALEQLNRSYRNFSLSSNFLRIYCFLKYSNWLLAVKRRSSIRKFLFCLKMFVKIK
ncbi:MAG: glycosyltransferase family 2 protein [Chitinophagaceae bacterium]|nr:glycosyltransferase family 2 protein [Chitinophagaceae bacterium]